MTFTMPYKPLIIIGAPRSGTNMLRDVLTRMPGVGTWPCDEINYIWRHGNLGHPSDEFDVALARPEVRRYIRNAFDRLARRHALRLVVEKTCANSLRVDFVDRVVPEARYIFIRRNGIDAAASAMKRWGARLDWTYALKKARYIPLQDMPYYAARHVRNRWHNRVSGSGGWHSGDRVSTAWRPRSPRALDEVCALQWQRCVEASAAAFARMSPDRWLEVSYEDYVRNPATETVRILDFIDTSVSPGRLARITSGVRTESVGRARDSLDKDARARLRTLLGDTLTRYGYA